MAHVKSPIVRKLKKALIQQFPPPAKISLHEHDGIIGVITSKEFEGVETIDRQDVIGRVLKRYLSPEERRQVQVIVGVTPDEGTGYLATVD